MLRRRRKSENCKSRSGFAGVGKKSKIFVRFEIASCAALPCFEMETLQVVLHKLVAGVTRLLSFHTCTFYDQSHHISRTLTAISEEHIPKALLIERSNDRLQWVTNEKKTTVHTNIVEGTQI